jgi:hypothetical protein
MKPLFSLNPVQELDLWLDSLTAHHQCDPVLPGLIRPAPGGRHLQEDVRTSLEIIRDLKQMAQAISDRESAHASETESYMIFLGEEIAPSQDSGACTGAAGSLVKFVDALSRIETVMRSFLRLPDITPGEFEAAGFILEEQIKALRENSAFLQLRDRYFHWQACSEIEAMVAETVADPVCRKRLTRMFLNAMYFVALVAYLRRGMSRGFRLPRIILLLTHAYLSLRNLLTHMEDTSRHLDAENPELAESLRGSRMTMQMDLGKVFKIELQNLEQEGTVEAVHARLERASGLMENAVRGCIDHLAGLIHPKLRLLAEEPSRLRDALKLLTDLHELHRVVQQGSDPLTASEYQNIRRAILRFRESSWKNLFASDRRPFDQLALELEYSEPQSRSFVVHQFQVFLATVIGQVQNRTVFTDQKTESLTAQA